MTTSVQAWAVALPDRAKSDVPGRKGSASDEGFADAVKFGKAGGKAHHALATDAAGETRRPDWNTGFDVPDRLAAIERAAKGGEEPGSERAEEKATPDEHAATGAEASPNAFRPPFPPMVLVRGYGRLEGDAASDGGLSKPAGPASERVGAKPTTASVPVSDKAGAVSDKAAVVTPPAVGAATGIAQTGAADAGARHVAQAMQMLGGEEGKSIATSQANTAEAVMMPAPNNRPGKPSGGVEPTGKSSPFGQPSEAALIETAKSAAAASATPPENGGFERAAARDSSLRENSPDTNGMAGRVVVLAQQNIPAPAAPPPMMAAAPLLTAIAADGSWRVLAATADSRDLLAQQAVASTHSLKVQLRPAELGMVTASLRFSGEQLTIELQVESAEAQQRLSADSDAIVKSLRALGLEVDRVTIQQSPVVQTSGARADANAGQNGQPAPDRQSFSAGNSGGGNGQAGGQQSGRSTSNGAQASQNIAPGGADRTGGGLYI